ncbi:MAG: winged helix-turn-helix transcriptional regulator [Nitrosarchaeum sp.]
MISKVNRVSKVLETINSNPGIQFRDLMEQTGLKNGVLSHYVNKIEKNGMAQVERGSRQTRFFPLKASDLEKKITSALRKDTQRKIILHLMSEGNKGIEFSSIPKSIGKSPSTVSTYLSQLVEENIISIRLENKIKLYFVSDKKTVDGLIDMYYPGFVEKAADSFADTFNSL